MDFRGLRLPWVLLAFVVALGLLFGGQAFVRRQQVDRPLDRFLSGRPEVEAYRLIERKGEPLVEIELGPVADLRRTYRELAEGVAEAIPAGAPEIRLEDRRDPELQGLYDRLQFALFEAVATGRFRMADEAVRRLAQEAGVEARLWVDETALYLLLRRGDAYLYEVLPRPAPAAGGMEHEA